MYYEIKSDSMKRNRFIKVSVYFDFAYFFDQHFLRCCLFQELFAYCIGNVTIPTLKKIWIGLTQTFASIIGDQNKSLFTKSHPTRFEFSIWQVFLFKHHIDKLLQHLLKSHICTLNCRHVYHLCPCIMSKPNWIAPVKVTNSKLCLTNLVAQCRIPSILHPLFSFFYNCFDSSKLQLVKFVFKLFI